MNIINNSLSCVINGDWNKTYIQPQWIGNNLFNNEEIGILLNGIGLGANLSYKHKNIIVEVNQNKFTFKTTDVLDESINQLEDIVLLFLERAKTPMLAAYGFNCDFKESDVFSFTSMLDSMEDRISLSNLGASIKNTTIKHTILFEEKTLNITEALSDELVISFNEHHNVSSNPEDIISKGDINSFIDRCKRILSSMDYDFEEE